MLFKHLLLPTDGSPLSEAAILKGIQLAREQGAKVTALHVSPRFHVVTYRADMVEDTREAYLEDSRVHGEKYLAFAAKAAQEAGVECQTLRETDDQPFQAIIDIARGRSCDLIVMASHGRSGFSALWVGSQTQRVLTHSKVPVLVIR